MRITPDELMRKEGISDEELCVHHKAINDLSHSGFASKVSKIPRDTRDKISRLYARCRENGYYPGYPRDGVMQWREFVTSAEGMRMWRQRANQAPASLAAMEPPPRRSGPGPLHGMIGGILDNVRP